MERGWRITLLVMLPALAIGCAGPAPPSPNPSADDPKKETAVALKIVVVDDPPLAEAMRREWKARSQAPLEVVAVSWKEGLPASPPEGDAVVYPMAWLGELAEKKWIALLPEVAMRAFDMEMPKDSSKEDKADPRTRTTERDDLSPLALQAECHWGKETWGIPFGSTGFTLYVRSDVLRDNGLSLPSTWEEYTTVVRRLRASPWAKDAQHVVATEPLGKGWGGLLLLARAASYLRHRGNYSTFFDFSSLEPLLTSPPMVKALEELVAASDGKDEAARRRTPAECLDLFWKGNAALAIGLPGRTDEKRAAEAVAAESVVVSELPGSPQVFNHSDKRWEPRQADEPQRIPLISVSGRIASLLTSSPHKPATARSLLLLSGAQWSPAISPASAATGPFRRSHLEQIGLWMERDADPRLSRDLADLIRSRFDAPLSMSPPHMPGGNRYLAALDAAVQSAVSGETKPADALAKAADDWRAITTELGLPAQKAAYRRSLGLKE